MSSIDWVTWAIWATTKKYSLNFFKDALHRGNELEQSQNVENKVQDINKKNP